MAVGRRLTLNPPGRGLRPGLELVAAVVDSEFSAAVVAVAVLPRDPKRDLPIVG